MTTTRARLAVAALLLTVLGGALFAQSGRVRVRTGAITVNPRINITPEMLWGHNKGPGPDSAQVRAMLDALGRADAAVCELAVDMLGNSWGGWTSREVGSFTDVSVTPAARVALEGRVKGADAISGLAASLDESNPCVRRAAARLLGHTDATAARERLRAAFRSGSPRSREAAAFGLGLAEDLASFDALVRALRGDEPGVARMSAWALGQIEDSRAVEPLADAMRSRDRGVRLAAIWALGRSKTRKRCARCSGLSTTPTSRFVWPPSRRWGRSRTVPPWSDSIVRSRIGRSSYVALQPGRLARSRTRE